MTRRKPQIGPVLMLAGRILLLVLAFAARGTRAQEGGTIFVALDGVCGGMLPCYAHPQDAVNAARSGDTIKLASGRYTGVSIRAAPPGYPHPPVSGLIAQMVYISRTLTLRGGYATTNWTDADPVANPTTLDAEGLGRVLFVTGASASCAGQAISPSIVGLRITGGDAQGMGGHLWGNVGGGGYVFSATARIIRNRVFGNSADHGGGLYLEGSSVTLRGNILSSNTGSMRGGGLGLYDSHASLSENAILSNTAVSGGGLYLYESDAMLNGNSFAANAAYEYGGGLYMLWSDAALDGNTFWSNTAFSGGGLQLHGSGATLQNDVVADNRAEGSGSGVCMRHGSSAHLCHTTIARNTGGDGSGVYVTALGSPSTVALTNTILAGHRVGISVTAGNMATLEGILWHDSGQETYGEGTILTGMVNVYGDPAFVDPDAGDYRIGPASAALDRGVAAGDRTDLEREPRPHGMPDMGADEYWPPGVLKGVYLPLVQRNHRMSSQGGGPQGTAHVVQRGETLSSIAWRHGTSVSAVMRANGLTNPNFIWVDQRLRVPSRSGVAGGAGRGDGAAVETTGRWIEVVLSSQRTIAWQGDRQVRTMVVSTGISRYPTPTGSFRVYAKYPSVTMSGPDYRLPGVPDTMFFYRGYAIHGTYWHENFGSPMSHGCVNLTRADAAWLYQWTPLGTSVVVRN